MSKVLIAALAAIAVLVSATVAAGGTTGIQGTVAAKFPENNLIRIDSRRQAHVLRVPGSQARIRVGQRVVLRGSTLGQRGNDARMLARGVVLVGSAQKGSAGVANGRDELRQHRQGRGQGNAHVALPANGHVRVGQCDMRPPNRSNVGRVRSR